MKKSVKRKTDSCKRKQIKHIKEQIKIIQAKVKGLRKLKPVAYRNSRENFEIVKREATIKELKAALDLLQSKIPKRKRKVKK